MQEDRVKELVELIDSAVNSTVISTCVDKVYNEVVPVVKKHILETYGPLPQVVEVKQGPITHKVTGIFHEKFKTVLKLVSLDLPVYLSGEAGTGKNVICKQIAEALGLEFYFTNAITQEYKLTGFIDANGIYHETQFYKAFKNGGLFFLDELDASIPEVLVILNAAIANRYFDFPTGKIEAHKDFRLIAAGNTFGTGADHVYSGRYCLDGASLDRFNIVTVSYSPRIEENITKGDKELLEFCHTFRALTKDAGIKSIFSYRGLGSITVLNGSMPLKDILRICLIKGMNADDLVILQNGMRSNLDTNNKYVKAFLDL
jgi:hypothetical protein|nr:MAG TPA: ATPase-like protein [Caudoviricetes sp.]